VSASVRPGDIIAYPVGMRREIERVTVQETRLLVSGVLAIRYRYTSNPQGIDWQGTIKPGDPDVRVLSRGVARVDSDVRSLVP
jgi:hypothetical protein